MNLKIDSGRENAPLISGSFPTSTTLKIKENTHDNNHRQSERKNPLDFYKNPTLIGLQNIGAAYYMNTILQCFSQIEELTNYFLDENVSGDKIINNNIAMKNKNLL